MESKSTKTNWLNIIGILLIIIAIILMIWFFAHGQTTVTGGWSDVETSESLVCNADDASYPFFTYDESRSKNIRINAVFVNDKLRSISLVYMLYYDTAKQITDSENINHASMNINYGENGLGADAFNAKFTQTPNALQFSIYSDANKINQTSAQYFMLNSLTSGEYTSSIMERIYANKGFDCVNNK